MKSQLLTNLREFGNGQYAPGWLSKRFYTHIHPTRIQCLIKLGFVDVKVRNAGRLSYRLSAKGVACINRLEEKEQRLAREQLRREEQEYQAFKILMIT